MRARLPFAAVLLAAFVSCASPQNLFRSENANWRSQPVVAVRTLAEAAPGSGPITAEISSPLLPSITVRGELAAAGPDEYSFNALEARVFGNWPNGWTEGWYEASGSLQLRRQGQAWVSSLRDPFRLWGIRKGEIRYYETFFRRDDGLKKTKQRVDRMIELSGFMRKSLGMPAVYREENDGDLPLVSFKEDVARLLFPERADFKELERAGRLAAGFVTARPEYATGEGLEWRTDYSKAVLPENLRELRDSGTLYRDFEEAPGLWMSFYNLPYLVGLLERGERFILIEEKG